jgi:transcriptional regulator with XRE-family HTH domain
VSKEKMTGQQLKKLRNKLGLSIAASASQVKITPRSWARYESGERRIPEGVVELYRIKNRLA